MTFECHDIDMSNGQANIAYVGDAPWHKLGTKLEKGLTIDEWKVAAGLNHHVLEAPVIYEPSSELYGPRFGAKVFKDRKVLYRSDTHAALSVVGRKYEVVQPGAILEFFRDLTMAGGYEMETAGSLGGGKRVWALARINDGENVIGNDRVLPYLLLATSFDGGMATIAKATAIRVVCRNTINMALRNSKGRETPASISIHHGRTFDPAAVKKELGISVSAWQNFIATAKHLATTEVTPELAEIATMNLLAPNAEGEAKDKVRESRNFKRIIELFNGKLIGNVGPSAWQWLNSVTQLVDHERGKADDSRMNSAWFGEGNQLKNRALELAQAL